MKKRSSFVSLFALGSSALLVTCVVAACGSAKEGSGFNDGDNSDGGGFGDGGKGLGGGGGEAGAGGCHGIGCNVVSCPGGGDTTISGTVYAPNGTLPLYNVIVFVPTDPLGSFTDGVSCDTCGKVSGNPVTSTISNPDGTFTLKGVPTGTNVPLVFQVGKWRREVTIPTITSCKDNPITDPNMSRLPKNHTEGDIPHIAMTTGGCDRIACVLPKMGLDASEFGVASDYPAKHVVEYGTDSATNLPGATSAQSFWQTPAEMAKYDLIVLSCECDETNEDKPPPAQQNMLDYLNAGG
ncbi:MAG: carboxypeptidase regulatory-like domain-containing protein, partial [Polyangiaceae bacterium]